jgi:hypothetical protein
MNTHPLAYALILGLSALTGVAATPAHAENRESWLVVVRAQETFVPLGFDDNDEAQVVIDGYLPDSCHRLDRVDVTRNEATGVYQVVQFARYFPVPCLPALVPFTSEVRLGAMPAGRFVVAAHGAAPQILPVRHTDALAPDDYLYAPVEAARVEAHAGGYTAVLDGRFTNTCMVLDDLRLVDAGKTKEVLPIMTMAERDDCEAREVPFSRRLDLPATLAAGRYLLHVRSLNGKAVNTVFSVR